MWPGMVSLGGSTTDSLIGDQLAVIGFMWLMFQIFVSYALYQGAFCRTQKCYYNIFVLLIQIEGLAKHLRCVGIDAAVPYSRKPEPRFYFWNTHSLLQYKLIVFFNKLKCHLLEYSEHPHELLSWAFPVWWVEPTRWFMGWGASQQAREFVCI